MMCHNHETRQKQSEVEHEVHGQPGQSHDYAEALNEILETLDDLHNIASEGHVGNNTHMNEREIMNLLRDVIYTAQETMAEIQAKHVPQTPILRIVEKFEKVG